MDTLRSSHSLPLHRGIGGSPRHVYAAQCWFIWHGSRYGDDFRTHLPHVPRHLHQHGDATLQDDGGRHGERAAEDAGLLDPEFPLQCRKPVRIPLPHILHLDRNRERGSRGAGSPERNHFFLCGSSHPDSLRTLYFREGERDASCRIQRVPWHQG